LLEVPRGGRNADMIRQKEEKSWYRDGVRGEKGRGGSGRRRGKIEKPKEGKKSPPP